MLIMNEVKEAERIINRDIEGYSPSISIGLLAKYYIKEKELSDVAAKKEIEKCIITNYPCINLYEWTERIDKSIKNAHKFPLKKIDEIPITQKEIDVVKSFPVVRQQRLTFTLLVIAKFNYLVSGHEWVNNSIDEINKVAGITWNNVRDKCEDIHELYNRKMIVFSKRIDSTSMKVLYMDKDKDSEPVLKVTSFENVGNILVKYDRNDYKHCIDCGKPFLSVGKSRRSKIRCDECQKKYRKQYKSDKEKEYRNSKKRGHLK